MCLSPPVRMPIQVSGENPVPSCAIRRRTCYVCCLLLDLLLCRILVSPHLLRIAAFMMRQSGLNYTPVIIQERGKVNRSQRTLLVRHDALHQMAPARRRTSRLASYDAQIMYSSGMRSRSIAASSRSSNLTRRSSSCAASSFAPNLHQDQAITCQAIRVQITPTARAGKASQLHVAKTCNTRSTGCHEQCQRLKDCACAPYDAIRASSPASTAGMYSPPWHGLRWDVTHAAMTHLVRRSSACGPWWAESAAQI